MKTNLILLLLLFAATLNAQKVTLHGDTILKDSKPYAILSNGVNSYTLKDISGKEIASITETYYESKTLPKTPNEKFWTVDFHTQQLIGQCQIKATNKQQLAELIVKENLFTGGVFNYHAGRFFIRQHQQPFANDRNND
ncbi:MAG: hypothetical protein ACRC3B_11010 [Bacteroidia bacterium]